LYWVQKKKIHCCIIRIATSRIYIFLCGIPEVLFESNATGAYQLLEEKTPAQALIYNQHKKAGQLVTQVVFSARVIDVLGFTSRPLSFDPSNLRQAQGPGLRVIKALCEK
jgi:hypothetical protein